MAENADDVEELLFFDTFSHEVNEVNHFAHAHFHLLISPAPKKNEFNRIFHPKLCIKLTLLLLLLLSPPPQDLNLDLVQFPKPVYITEVRIIPLGARVQACLGATYPSTFHIEFFVNDMGKPGASTFEYLGDFDYNQNDCIHLECSQKDENVRQIPTDGLVLRGWYTTITLAVYGKLTKGITEPITSPPAPEIIVPVVVPIIADTPPPPVLAAAAAASVEIETGGIVRAAYIDVYDDQPFVQQTPAAAVTPPIAAPPPLPPHRPPYSPPKKRRNMSSDESDWDDDDGGGGGGSVAIVQAAPPAVVPAPTVAVAARRTRDPDDNSQRSRYSRSSSRERDYRGKRDWSRSPEYSRHSRRARTTSYNKRDRSREHDRQEKRPRTPPMVSSSPRSRQPPRTPDRQAPSSAAETPKVQKTDHRKYEKSSRLVDSERIKSPPPPVDVVVVEAPAVSSPTIADPAATVAVDEEPKSPGQDAHQPFEPILSDEEIGDETESTAVALGAGVGTTNPQEMEDMDMSDWQPLCEPFNAAAATLERYLSPNYHDDEKELELATKILQKQRSRDPLDTVADFLALPIDGKENWIHAAEHLIQALHLMHTNFTHAKRVSALSQLLQSASCGDAILVMVKIGLSFECALAQPQPGYKIRHIKIGARLVELLGCCNELVGLLLFHDKYDVFHELFQLYDQKYMALSIKLMILKAVYACLDAKVAMDYFLTVDPAAAGETPAPITVYQRLIYAIQSNPLTRIKFALCALMRKVNLYESLQLVREIVTKLFVVDNGENRLTDFQLLKVTLEEVLRAYTWDEISYTQPKRFLPVGAKFEIVNDVAAMRAGANCFQSYFGIHAFLETLLLMVANVAALPENIVALCLDVGEALAAKPSGLEYLYQNVETTAVLVKCLMQQDGEVDAGEADVPDGITADGAEEKWNSRAWQLGVEIAYKVSKMLALLTP